jgi:DNA-binding PadR family transcriptional regulator
MNETDQKAAVLAVFLAHPDQDHYGLEIAEAAGLKPGQGYAELAWLEQAGLVTSDWEPPSAARTAGLPSSPRRRVYKLTPAGAKAAADRSTT